MKTNNKKILKLATLLITSLIIATASAQIYTFMYLQGTISVGSQKVVWVKDNEEVSGDTVTMTFDVEPEVTKTFNDTLYLKNKDTSNHTIVSIKVTDAVGDHFEICKAYVYENYTQSGQWTLVDVLDLKSTSSEITNKTLPSGDYAYEFEFEIRAATGGSDNSFGIKVTYE